MVNKNMKVTIQEIAHKANVSPSTVSCVLRGTTSVSLEKHEAVLDAVIELDYRPNIFAQSLASGQSMAVSSLNTRCWMATRPMKHNGSLCSKSMFNYLVDHLGRSVLTAVYTPRTTKSLRTSWVLNESFSQARTQVRSSSPA